MGTVKVNEDLMYFYIVFLGLYQHILTVEIRSLVDFPAFNPAWYSPIILSVYFLSMLLKTMVSILFPVHNNDIPL
jgi:hypothetical protein